MVTFNLLFAVLLVSIGVSHEVTTPWRVLPKPFNLRITANSIIKLDHSQGNLVFQVIEDSHILHNGTIPNLLGASVLMYQLFDKGVRIGSEDREFDFVITIDIKSNGYLVDVNWKSQNSETKLMCFEFGNAQWYGGPQQKRQFWPIQKLVLPLYSYIPKEADNAAITEPYWLNSEGSFLYVHKEVPLFIDQNNLQNNSLCIISSNSPPYTSRRPYNRLHYVLGYFTNTRVAHEFVIENYFKTPLGYPDYRMTELPIWSTWALYKRDINETIVLEFANKILENNFKHSQLEIDDLWETCYGSLTVNTTSFPDMKGLVKKLKSLGFRVTMWIHPFINKDCQPFYDEARQKGYLVKSEDNSYDTSWWNSDGPTSSYIDFTNKKAAEWFYLRLRNIQDTYDIDSFKFDAGETSWSPQVPVQKGEMDIQPGPITIDYVKLCARFGSIVEVRTGLRTQELPMYVRMIDKDSEWTFENGLPTLITTLLQMNMNGYLFVLPDMIGGNGYNGAPDKELFIRWLQANTFMPSLQFSYVPWTYDAETVNISRKFAELHEKYTYKIIEAFHRAVEKGAPVNAPIWWIDPTDNEAHKIWDEYLLGEDILVAPVIEKGAVKRDVYLPRGQWLAQGDTNRTLEGNQWIRGYLAPLDILPFFVKL